jgi:hypothetical protein
MHLTLGFGFSKGNQAVRKDFRDTSHACRNDEETAAGSFQKTDPEGLRQGRVEEDMTLYQHL